jgi:hypothetical protein
LQRCGGSRYLSISESATKEKQMRGVKRRKEASIELQACG